MSGSLSIRIRQARRRLSLSQAGLAQRIGVHRSAVAQWESSDGANPTTTHLSHIASVADVSFEWLATGRGRMPVSNSDDDVTPVSLDYLARDAQEEALLRWFRQLPQKARDSYIAFLRQADASTSKSRR